MRKFLLYLCSLLVWSGVARGDESALSLAREASAAMGSTLKPRLLSAIEQGQFTGAVAVCRDVAPEDRSVHWRKKWLGYSAGDLRGAFSVVAPISVEEK
jgi:hypothetical protein